MGYLTRYSLEIQNPPETWISGEDENGEIRRIKIGYKDDEELAMEIATFVGYRDLFEEAVKWYDHDRDMREISCKYPNTVFVLSGEGEDSGDLWRNYYKNGRCQETLARIIYDDYDESKLV